jgi:hypothetical protein
MSKEFKINAFKAYKDTKMPKGKDVIYELLNISPDKDNKGMFNIPWTYISPSDVIEHEGEFHEIGIVRTYNPDGSVVLNNEVSFMPSTFGRLALTPGNPMHEEVYRFFQWCNKNASNPNRREEVEPVFKLVNTTAFAKSEVDKKKALFEAQQIFFSMKDSEVVSVAKLLGIPEDEIEVVKHNLMLKVENNTDQFLKVAKKAPETLDSLVLIKKAIKEGVLKVNKELKTVSFGDDEKVVFEYFGGTVKEAELLADLEKNNPGVLSALSAQLEG